MGSRAERPYWREALTPYARPRLGRSLLDLATSVVPYLALSVAMYLAIPVSYLLVLIIAVPAAGFLVRTFIVFHDCSHGSFLPSKRANAWLALRGSSYLKLPKALQFFSGNIGLHHVHHLNARIPNYNLQGAHDEIPMFNDVPTLSLWDGLRAVRLSCGTRSAAAS